MKLVAFRIKNFRSIKDTGWHELAYDNITCLIGQNESGKTSVLEGSIGFQFGGKAFSEIIFFQDKRAYDEFTSGSFEFGATVQAVAITAGAQVQAGTTGTSVGASAGPKTGVQGKANYVNGMAVFVHSQGGLMLDFSIAGQKFSFEPL